MASDINTSVFVFKKTPLWAHPYISITRLDRPIGTWLLLLPCWWSIVLAGGFYINLMAKMALGAVLMRAAGCIVNDLWDRRLDAQVARTKNRPLAAGTLPLHNALGLLAFLLLSSFSILLTLPGVAIGLGIAALVPVALYPVMKRITWWPQLFLGFTFNWGALLGWAAVTNDMNKPALLLYLGGALWTLGYDTIYAHQDKEDDALLGVKSTARLWGDKSPVLIALCYGAALTLFIAAKYQADPSSFTPYLAMLPAFHAAWQLARWNEDDSASSLRVFRSNRDFGFLVLLMLSI